MSVFGAIFWQIFPNFFENFWKIFGKFFAAAGAFFWKNFSKIFGILEKFFLRKGIYYIMNSEKTDTPQNPRKELNTILFGISSYAETFDEDKIFALFVCNMAECKNICSINLLRALCSDFIRVALGKIGLQLKDFFKDWLEGIRTKEQIKAAAGREISPRDTIFDRFECLFENEAQMYISFLDYARGKIIPQMRLFYEIPKGSCWITPQMRKVQKTFSLSLSEIKYLGLQIVLQSFGNFYNFWDDASEKLRMKIASEAAGVDEDAYSSIIAGESPLSEFGIIAEKNYRGLPVLNKNIEQYIRGYKKTFTNFFYKKDPNTDTFKFESFDVSPIEKKIMLALLKSEKPCKILFCGAPGAGKTEFAKALIKEAGANLVLPPRVPLKTENYAAKKLMNFAVCDKIAGKDKKNVALFDECDEALADSFCGINKSMINSRLEKMAGKSVWICNSTKDINESTRRRFSFSVNFSGLSQKQKLAALKTAVEKTKLRVSETKIAAAIKKYDISTADIASCIETAAIAADKSATEAEIMKIIEAAAKSMAHFVHGNEGGAAPKYKNDSRFDMAAINCDADCEKLLKTLKKYCSAREKNQVDGSMNLVFAGAPGSGKTEFAKHIARELGVRPVVKRLSDLLSKYIGENEKNVVSMFEEAEAGGGLLIIDEADSLFINRETAHWEWQTSMTNEVLVGMENYRGILICTTNLLEHFDKAAMRRFQKKITFNYLKPDAAAELFKKYFFPNKTELRQETLEALAGIENLAPGDFKNVAQQLAFDGDEKTEKECLEMLERELAFKNGGLKSQKRVGFL